MGASVREGPSLPAGIAPPARPSHGPVGLLEPVVGGGSLRGNRTSRVAEVGRSLRM